MDGVLVIDKPVGPTSHDVVARARRALAESRIGHTGTLDPAASGVLPLVVGRATRLARFLSAGDKSYDAVVRLGFATDTGDAQGTRVGAAYIGAMPDRDTVDSALATFRGRFLQQPPMYSAKKVAGRRSYDLARAAARRAKALEARDESDETRIPADGHGVAPEMAETARPSPVEVTVHALDIVAVEADCVTLRVTCSAGFYVRSLA